MSWSEQHDAFIAETARDIQATATRGILWGLMILIALFALGACAAGRTIPPPAPPAQAVYIPVPVPCEVAPVESSTLNTDDGVPDDIFEATKQLLADLGLLEGDREKLQAANTDPCPEVTE